MKITRYEKVSNPKFPQMLAEFDVETEKIIVRGMKMISSPKGWFVAMPSVKVSEKYEPTVQFTNSEHHKAFMAKARELVEQYKPEEHKIEAVQDDLPF